jgi:hypothetical protein
VLYFRRPRAVQNGFGLMPAAADTARGPIQRGLRANLQSTLCLQGSSLLIYCFWNVKADSFEITGSSPSMHRSFSQRLNLDQFM